MVTPQGRAGADLLWNDNDLEGMTVWYPLRSYDRRDKPQNVVDRTQASHGNEDIT